MANRRCDAHVIAAFAAVVAAVVIYDEEDDNGDAVAGMERVNERVMGLVVVVVDIDDVNDNDGDDAIRREDWPIMDDSAP